MRPGSYTLLLVALAVRFLAELIGLCNGLFGAAVHEALLITLVLAAVHASTGRPGAALVRWAGLAAILARGLAHLPDLPLEVELLCAGISAAFLVLATTVLLLHLLRSRNVDADLLVGTLCIYLLIGTVWAFAYQLLQATSGPFTTHFLVPGGGLASAQDLDYFSFVTLTTLGYGDIQPLSAAARGMAVAEAVVGQFYLAVLVARLLGLHLAAARHRT